MAISPHSGQGWEWEQQTLRLQPSAGPATVASTLFATGRLNVSSRLREELEIHIPVVGGGGLYFKKKKKFQTGRKEASHHSLFYMVLPGVEEQWEKGWGQRSFGAASQAAWV